MESVIAIITSTQFPGHNDQHSIIEKLPGKTVLMDRLPQHPWQIDIH